jgi:hypothetical protein
MLRCSRFLPALIIAFVYASIAPISILARMRGAGWHWIWNDTVFGFFMLLVFPFAVAVFSCVVDVSLLKRAITRLSKLTVPVFIFCVMVAILPKGIHQDLVDTHRVNQPFMFRGTPKMAELDSVHERAFATRDFAKETAEYRALAAGDESKLSPIMVKIFFLCNFVNVGFAISVFCYILLVSVEGQIGADECNHLIFVLVAMSVWFPCRAYADWYINLTDMSWVSTYAGAAVLAILFIGAAVILALRMVEGSLYHRFAVPAAVISAVFGAIAALKPHWLSQAAAALEGFDPVFRFAFGTIIAALLYYISSSIHQRPAAP